MLLERRPAVPHLATRRTRLPTMTTLDPRLEGLARLVRIVDRLRAPDGCPWDRKQTLASMAPHVLEEAYEVVDALQTDPSHAVEEVGDLLMNLVLLGRIGQDEERFSLADIAQGVSDKLIRRHPHVFGDAQADDAAGALAQWEAVKQEERDAGEERDRSRLSGVPRNLPALLRAYRVGQKASQAGFEWPDLAGPIAKVHEELGELERELEPASPDASRVRAELGDLLFAVVNVARHVGVEPEMSLRETIDRFSSRFRAIEAELGDRFADASLEEMEAAWERAKRRDSDGFPTVL